LAGSDWNITKEYIQLRQHPRQEFWFSLLLRKILALQNTELRRKVLLWIYNFQDHAWHNINPNVDMKQSLDPITAHDVYAVLFPSTRLETKVADLCNQLRDNGADLLIGLGGMPIFFMWEKETAGTVRAPHQCIANPPPPSCSMYPTYAPFTTLESNRMVQFIATGRSRPLVGG
jgi:hypothetical protein